MIQFKKDTVISWNYEWGDEFNDTRINTEKWAYWQGSRSIFTQKEQEYYTDGKNHELENGLLNLTARKEGVDAKMVDWMGEKDSLNDGGKFYGFNKMHFNFTSGMIISNKLFVQGFFEIRFKAPKDRGMWPAFWLAGGYPNEEIDVLELKGEKPNKIHVDTHCGGCDDIKTWYGQKKNWGGWISLNKNLTDGFNVIAVEWQSDYIKFFLNGKSIAYVPVSFKVPKAIEANLALPSDDGPFHPGPKKDFVKSEPYSIDYIRVWNLPGSENEKNKKEDKTVVAKISDSRQENTKMKTKVKFLYGDKKAHAKDGAIVSLIPVDKINYVLYVLGTDKNKAVEVELKDNAGKTEYSLKTSEFQNRLDFSAIPAGNHILELRYNQKTFKIPLVF
ncbi:MAG: glycoside hydrolase family 16 protein [Bacteroidia bacterium]